MTLKQYDFDTESVEIIPPMPNGDKWAGKVAYIYETSTGKDVVLDPKNFGELRGATEIEAKERMQK